MLLNWKYILRKRYAFEIIPNFLPRSLCTCIEDSPFRIDEDFLIEDRGRELEHE